MIHNNVYELLTFIISVALILNTWIKFRVKKLLMVKYFKKYWTRESQGASASQDSINTRNNDTR